MKPRVLLLPTLVLAALTGCAGTPPVDEKQASAVDPTTVCEREQITGSKFQNIRCRTAADREQDKRDVDAISDAARRTRSSTGPGR